MVFVVELVNTPDCESGAFTGLRVQVPSFTLVLLENLEGLRSLIYLRSSMTEEPSKNGGM